MGTVASVHVLDQAPTAVVHGAIDEVLRRIEQAEAVFSTFRRSSQISRVNRGELDLLACDREVLEVLDACTWLEHESGGAFDTRAPEDPGRLDPAGFVKGWATERASVALSEAGLEHWYLSVGGDLVARSGARAPWRIAVADPHRLDAVVVVLEVRDGAVATSGTSERGAHLWDGRTGARPDTFASITVTGPSLTWADAFATTAFAIGEEGLDWVERFDGYEALAVTGDGAVVTTSGLRNATRPACVPITAPG